ncbi:MAG: TetR/AcrR family transcriptional regulator, partial [Acidimicrobiia bacterium]|nr:TetR/AcrR family transcriptional regulator [Acidimicrobiia bacterium]
QVMTVTDQSLNDAILDATKTAIERWGVERLTINDVCDAAKVSRATLYRAFPGGKEVLLEALRVREAETFFTTLRAHAEGETTLEDTIVRCMVVATTELRNDRNIALMLAAEPNEVLSQFTVAGVPRIVRVATTFLTPLLEPYLSRKEAAELVEVLARMVISYFLAPSSLYDFTNQDHARAFVRAHIIINESINQGAMK